MKSSKAALLLAMILAGASASTSALAWHHRGHVRFGVFIGAPFYPWYPPPYYYPYSYYPYPPAVVTVPSGPPVYIEQGGGQPAPQSYWYYCAESKTYYPYVKECPGGWQRVSPQPPPG